MPDRILTWDVHELQAAMGVACRSELMRCAKPLVLRIRDRKQEGALWILKVGSESRRGEVLDESLEAAKVWWPEPTRGSGDILNILPEENQITLRFCTTPPPEAGGLMMIYPARYLERLQEAWKDDVWVRVIHQWLHRSFQDPKDDPGAIPLPVMPQAMLRDSQKDCFELWQRQVSYLWGPPGTGKTHTLGYLLAHLLLRKPEARVLLLSTTNSAVDQALVSVDKALRAMEKVDGRCEALSHLCKRLGNRFIASMYEGREHLIPTVNKTLVKQLAQLEAQKPDPEDIQALAEWKVKDEELRAALKAQVVDLVEKSRLVAMTTTRATFGLEDLRACPTFDYLVFDESSQVGIAHALALAPLGRRVLFAGDPQQLSPVAQAQTEEVDLLFGHSMFDLRDGTYHRSCFLNEQSRMAEPICRVVSDTFYDGKLRVAQDCAGNVEWRRFRRLPILPDFRHHLHLEHVEEEWKWSQAYGGPIRHPSAEQIALRVAELVKDIEPAHMLVLTPFRSQRSLIKAMLRRIAEERFKPEIKKVRVSTVHRAQGMECHTVFFDPVSGDSEWLKSPDMACLINVALSRAQARLVVHLSRGDRTSNPLLGKLASIMKAARSIEENAEQAKPQLGGILIKKASQGLLGKTTAFSGIRHPQATSERSAGSLLSDLSNHYGESNRHQLREALGVSYAEMKAWLANSSTVSPEGFQRIQRAHEATFGASDSAVANA